MEQLLLNSMLYVTGNNATKLLTLVDAYIDNSPIGSNTPIISTSLVYTKSMPSVFVDQLLFKATDVVPIHKSCVVDFARGMSHFLIRVVSSSVTVACCFLRRRATSSLTSDAYVEETIISLSPCNDRIESRLRLCFIHRYLTAGFLK